MNILEFRNISAGYDKKSVIHNISFSIKQGEMLSILGPNGSGKSTLIKTIAYACKVFKGEILFKNKNINQISKKNLAKHIAIIPQSLWTPFNFTVYEFISFGKFPHTNIFGTITKKENDDINKIITELNLEKYKNTFIQNLSLGEFQRVLIAQGLAQKPEILILDEPISHLDIRYQKEIMELLKNLNLQGITIITVMHDINLANKYSLREIFIKNGILEYDGAPNEICTQENLLKIYDTDLNIENKENIPFVWF